MEQVFTRIILGYAKIWSSTAVYCKLLIVVIYKTEICLTTNDEVCVNLILLIVAAQCPFN